MDNQTRIIAFTNQKGGTGKTTSAINIGAGLTLFQKKVLLIDLDPQANLSISLKITEPEFTIEDLLIGKASLDQVIFHYQDRLDIIPSYTSFDEVKISRVNNCYLLKESLDQAIYDFILIDCPPHLSMLTINALAIATDIYIPIQTQFLALHGLIKLLDLEKEIRDNINPRIRITGIIPTFYDQRKVLNRDVLRQLKEAFGKVVFSPVRDNVSLAEAPITGQTIFSYSPGSHGAEDYMAICKAIIKRLK